MYDGVKAMIEKEKELAGVGSNTQNTSSEVMCGPHLKSAEELTGMPKFPPGTKSLLAKHLTPEIWAKYHDK